jgi:hypothetical protein
LGLLGERQFIDSLSVVFVVDSTFAQVFVLMVLYNFLADERLVKC